MSVKQQARAFRREHGLRVVNSAALYAALQEQGYTVIEFNGVHDTDDVAALIDALHLQDQVAHSRCFTYQDEKYRLIFVHEDLNDEERTIVLAHEAGHICSRHMESRSLLGADVLQEHEANEFAHFLLRDRFGKKKRCRLIAGLAAAFLVLLAAAGLFLKSSHDKAVYTEDYYRTENGSKYHLRDCIYIKDKTDVYRLTLEEYESGKYEPCSACMPDGRPEPQN